ncbi:hypothetical protein Tco_0155978 [Tanacetum coccineum]
MVFSLEFLDLVQKILDDEPGHNHGVVDLTGDEDLTDEDGDTGMGDSTGVLVSLGGEISSRGKRSRESNIGGGVVKVARCRSSVLVIVAVGWVVPRDGPIAGKTRSYGVLVLPEACLETCLEAWSLCFFACGVRWVKFPCFVILDFGSVLSVGSHGWRQSVDTKVGRSLISVPGGIVEPPGPDATSVGSSEDADVAEVESEAGEVDSGLKRKRATSDDGAGTSKRVRHVSLGLSTSTEEETPDAPPTLAAKEVTETPPPNVEVTSDSSAPVTHAAQSPPQTGPKAFEGMPVDQLMEEFDMVTAQQAALVTQLRARFSSERSQSVQKDEEILLLKTQLANAQAEAESSRSYAQNLAEEKMALLVKVEQERVDAADYRASCHWAVKYFEGGKNNHFAGLDEFRLIKECEFRSLKMY